MPREVVNIHIGQAGIQMANAAWEIFCLEHDINCDGTLKAGENSDPETKDGIGRQCFFEPTQAGLYVPRAVLIDSEPIVIDEILTGSYRNLFNQARMISGKEDASNNYARGYYNLGKKMIDDIYCQVRKATENCDCMQGFLLSGSIGGGTGSGIGSLLLEKLSDELGKLSKVQLIVYPSISMSTAIVEPYNCIMTNHSTLNNVDVAFIFDNEAIFDICHKKLNVERPNYTNINQVLAQIIGSTTLSIRFGGVINSDLQQLQTNLIPFPRLHFPLIRYSPIMSPEKVEHEVLNTHTLTRDVFHRSNQTIKLDTSRGLYMAVCMVYRGDCSINEANQSIQDIKERAADVNFVDWCPTGFKISHCNQPPTVSRNSLMARTSKSVLMMSNTTAMQQVFARLTQKFFLLFTRKAFVHWYVAEGMEEEEFLVASRSSMDIQVDYTDAGLPPNEDSVDTLEEGSEENGTVEEAGDEAGEEAGEEKVDGSAEENAEENVEENVEESSEENKG